MTEELKVAVPQTMWGTDTHRHADRDDHRGHRAGRAGLERNDSRPVPPLTRGAATVQGGGISEGCPRPSGCAVPTNGPRLDILEVTRRCSSSGCRGAERGSSRPGVNLWGSRRSPPCKVGNLPVIPAGTRAPDPRAVAALEAVENSTPEQEIMAMLAQTSDKALEDTLGIARNRAPGP